MRSRGGAGTFTEGYRRAQIIACVIEVVAERGYARASVRTIAARVGVAMNVVLYHFGSKAALMESVVEHVYTVAERELREAMASAGDPRQRLAAYVRGCVGFAWAHRDETTALGEIFANLRRADGSLRYGPAENAPMIDFVAGLLREGQASGRFADFDPRAMAFTIRAAIDALPATFATDPGIDGRQYADQLAAIIDRAVGAAGGGPDRGTSGVTAT